jgi:pyruvate dehydrogenase E2 component (dihydrolipoamide acetyltransferase)
VAAKLPPAATGAGKSNRDSHAGPAVRKLARELGVDLTLISPTGPRGRILKDDLHDFVKSAMKQISQGGSAGASLTEGATGIPPRPTVDFAKFGDVSVVPLSKIDRLTALNMQRSWLNVPHVTQFDDADITDLEEFRKSLKAEGEKRGVKVTPVAFLIKAVASALSQNPKFNSSLDAAMENRITKGYVNVGMAVDTPRGLVVPVIKDADKKGLWEIAAEVIELSIKARDGKLKPNEMQGGCFTVSSLGAMGGTGFTPIVNTPEVGILGVSKAQIKPVWNGSEFIPRQMLPLALSYDHCAINGGDAGRFMTTIVAELSDVRRLILN